MKEIYNLSAFKRGDFYLLSNKIVLNQTICEKDFSECAIRQVNFSNCIFDRTSFLCTMCENFTFQNCQLTCTDFGFINCKLNSVSFNAGELTDLKFDNTLSPLYLII
jgi:uncharacterized protein YjbI with pentapeptide repeats